MTDKEIRLGQSVPYSGPLSSYGTIGKVQVAYLKMISDQGGINGRRVNLISLDDGYSPPKALEQARKLVEEEGVLAMYGNIGTPTNAAIQRYLNGRKVPHILASTGASRWNDPKNFPWTMPWTPNYYSEAKIYGEHILKTVQSPKIAVLYQNDDLGRDYLVGLKAGLGDKAKQLIVSEASYEVTDPTIDSQMVSLKGSGANVFANFASPKAAALAIRKVHELQWKVQHYVMSVSSSVVGVLRPAGLEASTNVVTTQWLKDPNDPQWSSDAGNRWYLDFMKKHYPEGDPNDWGNVMGLTSAQVMEHILRQCGDDLTRENLMKQAANLNGVKTAMLLPGIELRTSATDFGMLKQMQLARFDGTKWALFGEVLGGR